MQKKTRLTREEREIERNADSYVPVSFAERKRLNKAIERSKKTAHISLRISERDLLAIKNMAEYEGIPYQTFITSILHKYSCRQLLDENHVRKVVETLK